MQVKRALEHPHRNHSIIREQTSIAQLKGLLLRYCKIATIWLLHISQLVMVYSSLLWDFNCWTICNMYVILLLFMQLDPRILILIDIINAFFKKKTKFVKFLSCRVVIFQEEMVLLHQPRLLLSTDFLLQCTL